MNIKKVISISLALCLIAIGLALTPSVFAQGTMECVAGAVSGGQPRCAPRAGGNNCEAGYTFDCYSLPIASCTGIHTCTSSGNGTSSDKYFSPNECKCERWVDPNFCQDYPPIETALGCIQTHPLLFIASIRNLLIGLGGGIAFLLMIIGAAFVLTSQGDPERVKRGKEVFIGALTGLIIMIFAVFLLRLIGADILGIFI